MGNKDYSVRFRADKETIDMLDEIKQHYGRPKSEVFKSFVKKMKHDMDEDRKKEDDLHRRLHDVDSIKEMILKGEEPSKIKEHIRYIYSVFH